MDLIDSDDDNFRLHCSGIANEHDSSSFPVHSNVRVEVESSVGSEDVAFNLTQEVAPTLASNNASPSTFEPDSCSCLQPPVQLASLIASDYPFVQVTNKVDADLNETVEIKEIQDNRHVFGSNWKNLPGMTKLTSVLKSTRCLQQLQDLREDLPSGIQRISRKLSSDGDAVSSQPSSCIRNETSSSASHQVCLLSYILDSSVEFG